MYDYERENVTMCIEMLIEIGTILSLSMYLIEILPDW